MAPDEFWRPDQPSYASMVEHLARTAGFPTYLPWPLATGWRVVDFGAVGEAGRPRATLASVQGISPDDGGVSLTTVAEEPGCGLGARVAGTVCSDPGAEIADRPADARLRVGGSTVPLWTVSTHDASAELDRSVLAGEADGRWFWLVVRPASALLMVHDIGHFADASSIGAPLLAVPFGAAPTEW
ncbi:DUF6758 family protein [Nocardioides jiangxiensis]|uniref:Uncharacterized protein n=1 Tax=Nocardioides jiangxiensis TaxID=3064524 RepID=A0ABT9AY03_9ACTN|nr:DUF6758 family protein [Nocardioides sp. WY-20]MDO7867447.1 hypothetical protein [Nocardioides sp. WY-20]